MMRPPLVRELDDVLLIVLDDLASVNDGQALSLRQTLYGRVEAIETPRVAIDLSAIDYLTSSGIAMMVGIKRRVDARKGRLVLFRLPNEVREVFGLMKLADLFSIVDQEEQALELLRSPTMA